MILSSVADGIARVTLNRPEKRNALSGELIDALAGALSTVDPSARVILLSGAGSDFCSGADLGELQRTADAGIAEHLQSAHRLADLFLKMRRHPLPIVAAVRGRALAGGCGLATACDLILASESAQFGYPEVKIGFVPAIVTAMLRRSVSEKRAFELIATGEIVSAADAHGIGLINKVYSDDDFDNQVNAYTIALASKSGSAVGLAKNLLYQMDGLTFESALDAGVQANAAARMTDDAKRGIAGFVKKNIL